jgi:hypothetical protein
VPHLTIEGTFPNEKKGLNVGLWKKSSSSKSCCLSRHQRDCQQSFVQQTSRFSGRFWILTLLWWQQWYINNKNNIFLSL